VKNKKYKRKYMIYIGFIALILTAYFVITQPLFFKYESVTHPKTKTDAKTLKQHVKFLSELDRTSEKGQEQVISYILDELAKNNIDKSNIKIQKYKVGERVYKNIIVSFKNKTVWKTPRKKHIIGAHYDAYGSLPGANDNASGVAGLLEASKILQETPEFRGIDIDLVFYGTEEPPFFGTENMGSFHHAQSVKDEKNIKMVLVFDMIGYFSEEENSQNYPVSFMKYFYPTQGNFIALVSNLSNSFKTRKVKRRFASYLQKNNLISVASMNAPASIQGIDFSDHRNYWKFGFPAVLITDTAFMRGETYHTQNDTYEKLNYNKMKEVVDATVATVLSI
jgi:Zn-dependent M28 family amino/carboxypeptidase